jgi:hypothetical protein
VTGTASVVRARSSVSWLSQAFLLGPCFTVDDLSGDEHAHGHIMLVEIPSGQSSPC